MDTPELAKLKKRAATLRAKLNSLYAEIREAKENDPQRKARKERRQNEERKYAEARVRAFNEMQDKQQLALAARNGVPMRHLETGDIKLFYPVDARELAKGSAYELLCDPSLIERKLETAD